ncbi:MAG: ribosomal protein S6 modification protein [Lysobacteraceae bacterium]|nr:MAG: ribosomal protein S6 modification protein [Xanthomonadaceae bacterium]
MKHLIVVDNEADWGQEIANTEVVTARHYLANAVGQRGGRVFNLCRSYAYQSTGYYVSLLAAARKQRPLPDVMTMQDIHSRSLWRVAGGELDAEIQRSLRRLASESFELSVYFGRNLAAAHNRLARQLFNLFPAPLLRAKFERADDGDWHLVGLRTIALDDVSANHREFLFQAADLYFAGRYRGSRPKSSRYDLAILVNEQEQPPPSNAEALKRFERAAQKVGFAVQFIDRGDYGRLAEFDALFIRETTLVNHHTYRFARRAAIEGLQVIDDPDSILRCTNKVFLAELLKRQKVSTPRSMIIHRGNANRVVAELGLPCVLKQPDGAFSAGVIRVEDEASLKAGLTRFLRDSDLVLGQSFVPTEFDWRIGILDGQPLYACRYYMAAAHWQIIQRDNEGNITEGDSDTVPIDQVPSNVMETALRAARAIGNGLYGVDLKACGDDCHVIEVNDNPTIDHGVEDLLLGDRLYEIIMGTLMKRVEASKEPASRDQVLASTGEAS